MNGGTFKLYDVFQKNKQTKELDVYYLQRKKKKENRLNKKK